MKLFLVFIPVIIKFGHSLPTTQNPPIPGGEVEQDATDPLYTKLAWMAFEAMNKGNGNELFWVPIKVLTARTQVISGSRTVLEVLVGQSPCEFPLVHVPKDVRLPIPKELVCEVEEDGKKALFEVVVLEKPWKTFVKITAEKIKDVIDL